MTELTNDAVAEQVMGWTKRPHDREKIMEWFDANDIIQPCFYPLRSARADFVVFDKAREWFKTDDRKSCAFWHQLAKILRSRSPHMSEDFRDLHLMHYYKVGDYSRAAMAAVMARRERDHVSGISG